MLDSTTDMMPFTKLLPHSFQSDHTGPVRTQSTIIIMGTVQVSSSHLSFFFLFVKVCFLHSTGSSQICVHPPYSGFSLTTKTPRLSTAWLSDPAPETARLNKTSLKTPTNVFSTELITGELLILPT